MTITQLKQLLGYYQKLFRLQDWRITVRFAKPWEMGDSHNSAEVKFQDEFKDAYILILDECDRETTASSIERDLIHELLHTVLERAKFDLYSDKEIAINMISDAIMKLRGVNE